MSKEDGIRPSEQSRNPETETMYLVGPTIEAMSTSDINEIDEMPLSTTSNLLSLAMDSCLAITNFFGEADHIDQEYGEALSGVAAVTLMLALLLFIVTDTLLSICCIMFGTRSDCL